MPAERAPRDSRARPPGIRPALAFLLLLQFLAAVPASGQAGDPVRVWVNLRSGVYHCPGSEHYGRTARGMYLPEPEARARGHRANGGRACGPLGGADSSARGLSLDSTQLAEHGPAAPAGFHASCLLTEIIDGDSLRCAGIGSIRLIGLDAPERRQAPHGPAATAALRAMLPLGTTLFLERDNDLRDKHGRLLAYAWVDGRMVNWLMLRLGWGVAYPFRRTARYEGVFAGAERAARMERRGLWGVGGFDCLPRKFRAGECGR